MSWECLAYLTLAIYLILFTYYTLITLAFVIFYLFLRVYGGMLMVYLNHEVFFLDPRAAVVVVE